MDAYTSVGGSISDGLGECLSSLPYSNTLPENDLAAKACMSISCPVARVGHGNQALCQHPALDQA